MGTSQFMYVCIYLFIYLFISTSDVLEISRRSQINYMT